MGLNKPVTQRELRAHVNNEEIHRMGYDGDSSIYGIYDNGNSGSSKTIDWTNGNKQKITTTDDCTLTFTAPASGRSLQLIIIHEASATAYSYTYPASVKWQGGTKIETTNTTGAIDVISFLYDGTNYLTMGNLDFS